MVSDVLEVDGACFKALYLRGLAYVEKFDMTSALKDFKDANILDPSNEAVIKHLKELDKSHKSSPDQSSKSMKSRRSLGSAREALTPLIIQKAESTRFHLPNSPSTTSSSRARTNSTPPKMNESMSLQDTLQTVILFVKKFWKNNKAII